MILSKQEASERHGISLENLGPYILLKELPNGKLCGVLRLMYHYTVVVDIRTTGFETRWCFSDIEQEAIDALMEWNGQGEMAGRWRKDVFRGIYRDPDTNQRWTRDQPRPPKEMSS